MPFHHSTRLVYNIVPHFLDLKTMLVALEPVSNDTKVITQANHGGCKKTVQPIWSQSNSRLVLRLVLLSNRQCKYPPSLAWEVFSFGFVPDWLRMLPNLWGPIQKRSKRKTKAITWLLSTVNWKTSAMIDWCLFVVLRCCSYLSTLYSASLSSLHTHECFISKVTSGLFFATHSIHVMIFFFRGEVEVWGAGICHKQCLLWQQTLIHHN